MSWISKIQFLLSWTQQESRVFLLDDHVCLAKNPVHIYAAKFCTRPREVISKSKQKWTKTQLTQGFTDPQETATKVSEQTKEVQDIRNKQDTVSFLRGQDASFGRGQKFDVRTGGRVLCRHGRTVPCKPK